MPPRKSAGGGGLKKEHSSAAQATPDILLQPPPSVSAVPSTSSAAGGIAAAASAYSHGLPSVSPALNHAHSMDGTTGAGGQLPPHLMMNNNNGSNGNGNGATSSASASSSSSSFTPELRDYMKHTYPTQYKTALTGIDMYDYKSNKHSLPLARIKKIMKSDEDVRMISAEAPVLFAKACELFILDLSLRAYAVVEHSTGEGEGRRTMQRNDVAMAIQNSELFDFLYQIVPVTAYNPDEEGTPPFGPMDERYASSSSRSAADDTPDVLLERPLSDPYGDAIPSASLTSAAARHAAAHSTARTSHINTRAHHPRNLPHAGSGASATTVSSHTSMTAMSDDSTQMSLLASPSSHEFAMGSLSRGVSMDPNGGIISTPVFGGLELVPNTPNQPLIMTPLQPPATPGAFLGGGNVQTPYNDSAFLSDTTGIPETPISTSATSLSTPNFQSEHGYSADASVGDEENLPQTD